MMLTTSRRYLTILLLGGAFSLLEWCGSARAVELAATPPVPKSARPADSRGAAPRHRPNELLVKFREGVTDREVDSVLREHRAAQVGKFQRFQRPRKSAAIERWRLLTLSPGPDLKAAATALRRNPLVEHVEPNYEVAVALAPDDPRFPEQWALHNSGQTGGAADADIDAPEAWDFTTGDAGTTVAVIDTGVDRSHPDLASSLWVNSREIAGNGIDDDANGYVDDVHGYDFRNYDADPGDDHGHGTHVAGIIAAAGNNDIGVSGVAWQARVMSLKFLGSDGFGWVSDAVNAVLYASDNGARVMNNSWGGGGYSQALRDAIAAANEDGILFVAAAGNYGNSNDHEPFYPAGYDIENVVAVGASDKYDQRTWFSNFGRKSVLLAAPGQDILSTVPQAGNECCSDASGYKLLSGTSMAAPHVSGVAALLLAQDPARTAFNLVPLLHSTVDSTAGGALTRSGGRLNAAKAAGCDPGTLSLLIEMPYHGFVAFLGEPLAILARVHSCGYPLTSADVKVAFNNGDPETTLFDDGGHGDGAAGDGIYGGTWTAQNISSLAVVVVTASDAERGTASLHRSGVARRHTTYRFEPTSFDWIDTAGGSAPALNWFGSAAVPLDFGFEFYGQIYDTVYLNTDGYLSIFGPANDWYYPTRLPDPATPNGLIAPYWRELYGTAESRIRVLRDGSAPNRRLTVAWVNLRDSRDAPVSFQVTLFEGTNDIRFQYLQLPGSDAGASIGVEDQGGTEGTQHSYYSPELQEGAAIRFHPGPYNRGPTANAGGPYIGLPGQPIAFDGSASSDPESDALTYRWNFGDSATATGAQTSHAYAAKGNYTVTLTVSDGIHDSLAATAAVTVQNRPPVAVVSGDATGRRGYAVNLNGSGSYDPDGDVLETFRWNFGDGSAEYVAYRYGTMQHIFNQLGTFTVTLVVNDKLADSAPAGMTVTIANVPPTADAGSDLTANSRTKVFLSSNSWDPDGQIVTYQWRQVAGQAVTLVDANTALASFTAPNARAGSPLTLEFELTVTDNDGAKASDRKTVTVVK